ncbi:MAG: segregation/condensation protein A [Candidatus Hadarchaeales archaeon]
MNLSDQPVQELVELVRLHKLSPWDVDISKLISIYRAKLKQTNEVDLRVPSRVVHSSATLLKIKSEIAVRGESEVTSEEIEEMLNIELPELGELTIEFFAPQRITLEDLLGSLREVLATIPETKEKKPVKREELKVDIQRDIDAMLLRWMEDLLLKIKKMVNEGKTPTFFSLLSEKSRVEFVRVFLTLIFLSSDGKIRLEQSEPFTDIKIELLDGGKDGDTGGSSGS